MFKDLHQLDAGTRLQADVCIAGTGVAGISLARRLSGQGLSILMLESGGWEYEPATHALTAGENLGAPYYDLEHSRLRFFGGTLRIWGGRCAPLDAIDYTPRHWVQHSGWPIGAEELKPYYESAHQALDLGPFDYSGHLWQELGVSSPAFDPRLFTSGFWRFDQMRNRFAREGCSDLLASPDVTILLHANVVKLQADTEANGIAVVQVSTLEGKQAQVSAGAYVLACGGLENPRILLASNDIEAEGIGNRYDQVGRYFMEHPHGRAGFLRSKRIFELWSSFRKQFNHPGVPLAPVLRPSEGLQRRYGLLNTAITFKLQRDPRRGVSLDKQLYFHLKHRFSPNPTGLKMWHAYRDTRAMLRRHVHRYWQRVKAGLGVTGLSVMVRAEQSPNPASRVRLGRDKDALGIPRLALDWRLNDQDKRTVAVLADVLAGELDRLGFGRLQVSDWLREPGTDWPLDQTIGHHPIGGFHHMGTTRMSASPRSGVVDADCRVHGYRNLYIAGSSVFPTGGWANPSLTIVALAHRLGDHLARECRHGNLPNSSNL